jgi:hypothetical protein
MLLVSNRKASRCEKNGISILIFHHLIQTTSHPIFQPSHHNPNPSKMQLTTLALTAFATLSSAAALKRALIDLCPALNTPQCCQVDVDGVLDLTCAPHESITPALYW